MKHITRHREIFWRPVASVLWAASLLAPEIAFGLLMSTLAVLFDPRVDVRACIWLLVD